MAKRIQCTAHLPHELVIEVLLRLPVKSLVRFKCVCKEWFTDINDPEFAKAQLQQSKSTSGIIVSSEPGKFSYVNCCSDIEEGRIDFDFGTPKSIRMSSLKLEDSCNGLVLLRRKSNDNMFYVCNFIAHLFLKLPSFTLGGNCYHWGKSLAYDESNKKHKVVVVFDVLDSERYAYGKSIGVFTLDDIDVRGDCNGSWRDFEIPTFYDEFIPVKPTSINGVLHWLTYNEFQTDEFQTEVNILQMNLASEDFKVMEVPVTPRQVSDLVLLKLKDSLHLTNMVSHNELDLWVLNDPVKQTWSKQHRINFAFLIEEPSASRRCFNPIFAMEKPTPVIIFYCTYEQDLLFYDLNSGKFQAENKESRMRIKSTDMFVHVNSLITC